MTNRAWDNDNELIDELAEAPTPGQGNAGGGDLRSAEGDDSSIIRAQNGDKDCQVDEPPLPHRQD